MENMTILCCGFNMIVFTKNDHTWKKNEKGPKNYTVAKLCPAHHVNVTARRLCALNETVTVSHNTVDHILLSLLLLSPLNTRAHLHTVSLFYHWELNSEKWQNYRTFGFFLALLIVHRSEGKIIVQMRQLSHIRQHCFNRSEKKINHQTSILPLS